MCRNWNNVSKCWKPMCTSASACWRKFSSLTTWSYKASCALRWVRIRGYRPSLQTIQPNSKQHCSSTVGCHVVFLNIFDDRRAYTKGEHCTWLTAAGFVDMERVVIAEGVSIITARKPV